MQTLPSTTDSPLDSDNALLLDGIINTGGGREHTTPERMMSHFDAPGIEKKPRKINKRKGSTLSIYQKDLVIS